MPLFVFQEAFHIRIVYMESSVKPNDISRVCMMGDSRVVNYHNILRYHGRDTGGAEHALSDLSLRLCGGGRVEEGGGVLVDHSRTPFQISNLPHGHHGAV